MKNYNLNIFLWMLLVLVLGCDSNVSYKIKETKEGLTIPKGTNLTITLQTGLSSNTNVRGDLFTTKLVKPLKWNNKTILSSETIVKGIVKRASKYEKFGDRASLALLFDQLLLSGGNKIPIVASLDTDNGKNTIKIQGKGLHDATVIGGSALVGALVGGSTSKDKDSDLAKKGMLVGATIGTGAVLLSNRKEVKLPEGTEIIIKLEEAILIPSN